LDLFLFQAGQKKLLELCKHSSLMKLNILCISSSCCV